MPVNGRRKGHDFEREMTRAFRELMPGDPTIRRGLQYRDGAEAPDVETQFFHVECKRGRKPNPRAALAQAERDCDPNRRPIAIIKDDRCKPFVVMSFELFSELVRLTGIGGAYDRDGCRTSEPGSSAKRHAGIAGVVPG